jgi:ketosteroid isomerase-like protein
VSEQEIIARLREAYAAFGKGDLEALQAVWSPDILWYVPGNNPLAGTYEGIPAVLGFLGQALEVTGGTLRVEPQTFCAGGDLGIAVVRVTGQREGRSLDVLNAQMSRFEGDRIVEFRDTTNDPDAIDAFFA